MRKFVFGSYVYEYMLVREKRKSLSLTVTPDSRLIVKGPHHVSDERIEAFLRRKWLWLEKQLAYFKKFRRKVYVREYISGESYLYIGRQYKLLVERSPADRVILSKGLLRVYTTHPVSDAQHTKKLLNIWYSQKTADFFTERYEEMIKRFDYKESPRLVIRDMPKRWGSFLSTKKIVLNPKLMYAPRECIDYVVVHELCHIRYKNHDKRFFEFLGKKYPKWDRIKEKLEMYEI